ncbi:MAG: bifunctional (p)ppGpp synthetase/guanosine-3',5'-bis(diphosphate) 3'-pyrophosphohydrolase [Spirochaetales bacterium]|nr:bifunctional (p)ppGpp synthetase/guanosine-3',5'-bis(diphosphate) 3'-pyrophosphohydrolase [Spirochaetales bacterium]
MEHTVTKFEGKLARYTDPRRKKIVEALEYAELKHKGQKRLSGEPFFIHPLSVASTLVDMQMDYETIIAALLHDVLEDTETSPEEMKRKFGGQIVQLVDGITKISTVRAKSKTIQEAETLRKMLIAMTKDIRVIIIKLADKLHNMSTLEYMAPERQKAIARECLEIYAPLAGRLGMSWLKDELEDLSLKHLNPQVYNHVSEAISANEDKNHTYLHKVKRAIHREVKHEVENIKVDTRAKHIYSVYRKMKTRNKELNEIYDLLGLRIRCNTPSECYTLLGIVHRLWPPIEGRFKDYIAMPKTNQYQSLHTTVMCYEGRLLEIQIRTHAMHRTAEHGVAAHWAYKRSSRDKTRQSETNFIHKLKKWNNLSIPSMEYMDEIKKELLKDSIYVFTPRGHIVEMPKGSTPVDFAYHIHTEIGHHCVGAKTDGVITTLNTPLKSTQVVEVMTSPNGSPNLNWLKFVRTGKARSRIRQWLNKHDDTLFLDKNIIAKKKVVPPQPPVSEKTAEGGTHFEEKDKIVKEVQDQERIIFKIGDEKNMMISIAKCCHPNTGDDIIGFVSRGRGIIVHRKDCPNLKHIADFNERRIVVEWEASSPRTTKRFRVTSRMRNDLFSEIEGAVRKYKGHLIEGRLEEDDKGHLTGAFTMEMDGEEDYKKALKSIRTIPSVLNLYLL